MKILFFKQIDEGHRFLIAGAGGGFDIAHGIPLYLYITQTLKKEAILANFSFSNLANSYSEYLFYGLFKITRDSARLKYFPEKYTLEWLWEAQNIDTYMYGFSNELGVKPLKKAYEYIINQHNIDSLIIVDGGTDSIIFGDEEGLGTIVEDATSMIAAADTSVTNKYLAAIGFGIDHFHGVNHYNCLENIATLIKDDGYLGAFSLTKDMEEGEQYLSLTNYLNKTNIFPSIVNNSIASALEGDFGNIHRTNRTSYNELFINPLMPLYWTFDLNSVVNHMQFADGLRNTETNQDVIDQISISKIDKNGKHRYRQQIPL